MDSGLNIVVVEDHDDLRDITVGFLRGLGHAVRGVADAAALDAALRAARADLLVLDLNLPGEDGISLARRLRAAQPRIGIIMVTARDLIGDRIRGYESGADIYLTKPTAIEELRAAIDALARRLRGGVMETALAAADRPAVQERIRALHDDLLRSEGKLPTLAELARRCGLPERRLNESFAEEYGAPVHAYLTARRLEQARAAIVNTDVPLKVIADRLGYAHVNHFNAAFSKRFGYPPGRLRKWKCRDAADSE